MKVVAMKKEQEDLTTLNSNAYRPKIPFEKAGLNHFKFDIVDTNSVKGEMTYVSGSLATTNKIKNKFKIKDVIIATLKVMMGKNNVLWNKENLCEEPKFIDLNLSKFPFDAYNLGCSNTKELFTTQAHQIQQDKD